MNQVDEYITRMYFERFYQRIF